MKEFSTAARINRRLDPKRDVTCMADLLSHDHLGLWHRSYWKMRIRTDAAEYRGYLKDILAIAEKTSHEDAVRAAHEVHEFLNIPEVKAGFAAADAVDMLMVHGHVAQLLKPRKRVAEEPHRRLRAA